MWSKIFRTSLYQKVWPVIELIPPETAHKLAIYALRLPFRMGSGGTSKENMQLGGFDWQGLHFRNRVGIAAGFDKDAACMPGIERLGAGFVEVGTILVEPWKGHQVHPRIKRLPKEQALWNRLGFPSAGLEKIKRRLAAFPREKRKGLLVACNIGPHPGHLTSAKDLNQYLKITSVELLCLAEALFEHADFFVVNLSSPNTPGLRDLLQSTELVQGVFLPLKQKLQAMDREYNRAFRTLLITKVPPEDSNGDFWSADSLRNVVNPLMDYEVCDGFVATNTSIRLTKAYAMSLHIGRVLPGLPGGISGSPLRDSAINTIRLLRQLIGKDLLIIGSGGIVEPSHVLDFIDAGANLVEIYSGFIYRGPAFIQECTIASMAIEGRTGRSGFGRRRPLCRSSVSTLFREEPLLFYKRGKKDV